MEEMPWMLVYCILGAHKQCAKSMEIDGEYARTLLNCTCECHKEDE